MSNGYRRYQQSKLATAGLICMLRRLDMPLSAVAEVVATAGPHGASAMTISPSSNVPIGKSCPAVSSSGKAAVRSFRFLLSRCTQPLGVRQSRPRKPSSFSAYRQCAPVGSLRSRRASIGTRSPPNTKSGGYSVGTPRKSVYNEGRRRDHVLKSILRIRVSAPLTVFDRARHA